MFAKIFAVAALLFVSSSLFAATHGGKTINKVLINNSSGIYFTTHQSMVDTENCGSSGYYHVMKGAEYEKEMFSVLLAAKVSGAKVTFNLSGCGNGYPKVNYIIIEE